MADKFYITTAIDYVNAKPHIGHAFEKVLADAIARWHRLLGDKVFYLTGTDENAQKNATAAKEVGIPTKKFVDENSKKFIELCKLLDISNDDFIRTTESRHVKVAQEIFKKIYDKGDIYKGKYEGLYCTGCEGFKTEKDLVDGKCPEHNRAPEEISEETYFFKLSKYEKQITKFIKDYIVPESKKKEILARLKEEGLKDLCVARKNLDWGIDCPIDKNFKIYVWLDALGNYYSGANGNWPADLHVIGKGINWFHSVIWPAILISAGIKLPKKLLVHGYLTFNGQKISKSLGNTIDPIELVNKYSVDAVRYNLLRGSTFDDFDFSESALIERNNNELADKYGNLISRVSTLAEKYGIEKSNTKLKIDLKRIKELFENFEVDKALAEIFSFIDQLNEYTQNKKPWETHDKKVLYDLLFGIRDVTILLHPFIPNTTQKIADHFGFKISLKEVSKPLKLKNIKKAPVFFNKIEQAPKPQQPERSTGKAKPNLNKSQALKEIMAGIASIEYSDFGKLDLRVGKIEKVEEIEGADKLYKLTVDIGTEKRTICAGIKEYYSAKELKGKLIIVLVNLQPRILKGVESQGMLLAAGNKEAKTCVLITPDKETLPGTKIS